MTSKSQMKRVKVQKGKKALPTRVHKPRNKRADKYKGIIYEDWYEQQMEEYMGVENEENS